ncbi:hypothetical protein B296_00045470 [Ensete ventricosum]|uniref:Uncharacterized protein n=1 Tax=Ensete ventricosum TaxID=4639 RepID=A0A426Z7A5_ENSVE|nr:hypothetical protein B296_00045470 [Ensete ventricosum]
MQGEGTRRPVCTVCIARYRICWYGPVWKTLVGMLVCTISIHGWYTGTDPYGEAFVASWGPMEYRAGLLRTLKPN